MRVTSQNLNNFAVQQLGTQSARLQDLQRQLSTGLKAERPSDDPASIRKALIESDRVGRFEQHEESLSQNTARLGQAHTQLQEVQQLFVRAKEIALSGRQATDNSEVDILAQELDGILDQLVTIANSEDHNGFLFAGTRTSGRPFSADVSTQTISPYAGTEDSLHLYITGRETSVSLQPGLDVFSGVNRGSAEIIGDNGIAIGSGGASAVGFHRLTVQHLSTEFLGGSGIDEGVSASLGDTIIGSRGTHSLVINDTSGTGAFGTLSLNGGPEVAFTNADTDLEVIGRNGEKIYVNTENIVAGFSAEIDLIASGTISTDGGVTDTAIGLRDNQQIVDSRDGSVLFLDTREMNSTRTVELEFTGTFDAFQSLVALKEDLTNARDFNRQEQDEAIGRRIEDIDRIGDHLLQEIGVQSVNLQRFDQMSNLNESQKLSHELNLAEITAVDFAAAAIQLQETLNLQQYTMATVGLVTGPNLLEFLN